jgi:hypothetical protein
VPFAQVHIRQELNTNFLLPNLFASECLELTWSIRLSTVIRGIFSVSLSFFTNTLSGNNLLLAQSRSTFRRGQLLECRMCYVEALARTTTVPGARTYKWYWSCRIYILCHMLAANTRLIFLFLKYILLSLVALYCDSRV